MMNRFQGREGRQKLIEALLQQEIVAGVRAVAENLADAGEVVQFEAGSTIIEQDADDDSVYLLLNGRVDILISGTLVGSRDAGTIVGEMAATDPTARRSATVTAATVVTALVVSASEFKAAGSASMPFSHCLVRLLAQRLRERSKFHLRANPTPIMFVGSSAEGVEVVNEIEARLEHDDVIVRPWTKRGVFGPSRVPIEDLLSQVDEADFALFVFGPDDKTMSRGLECHAPRDNVVFEMGLFIGRLGRERVFMVKDADVELKLPSDLSGVNPLSYKRRAEGEVADFVGPICTQIRHLIRAKGPVTDRFRVE